VPGAGTGGPGRHNRHDWAVGSKFSPKRGPQGRARVLRVPGADAEDDAGDRNYLVLAKPSVIMNDARLRGLRLQAAKPPGRKSTHNHAQTVRNLGRSPRENDCPTTSQSL
jgi:hypothetical protein